MSRICVLAWLLASAIGGTAFAQAPSGTPEPFSYSIMSMELVPRPIAKSFLLRMDAVQQALKLAAGRLLREVARAASGPPDRSAQGP